MGICGYIENQNITNDNKIIKMTHTFTNSSVTSQNILLLNNVAFGNNNLRIITRNINNVSYTINFTGSLYNSDELKLQLKEKGHTFLTNSEIEIVLLCYIEFKEKCLSMLNGAYSFAIYGDNKLFLARDRLGIKPLFYYNKDSFIFSSEIKCILKHGNVKAKIGKDEICEIFGLGPAHTPGKTFYKDIYEIKPGHFGVFENNSFNEYKYWDLETYDITDTIDESISNIKTLVSNSLTTQLKTEKPICSMLSRRTGF